MTNMTPPAPSEQFAPVARDGVLGLGSSKIREVANAAMGRSDVLPFWFGEPDQPTPDFICQAAMESLQRKETFYTQNLGITELRATLAAYVSHLHTPRTVDHIAVTSSGVSALMLAMQSIIGPGDRVVAVTPVWPNLVEIPAILGATVVRVGLDADAQGWRIDLQKLLDALQPGTRALIVSSPNNPTGWALTRADCEAILQHCRKHGIWIVDDAVYERCYFHGPTAPSFLDFASDEDRIISCNSFSKAWRMTGWRLGWMVAPLALVPELAKLIEYNTSCAPGFIQRAAIAAVEHGETEVQAFVQRLKAGQAVMADKLGAMPRVLLNPPPDGAMYAFFKVDGMHDSVAFAKDLIARVGLGLAPGVAFGPEGEGYLRWCFASSEERLLQGLERFARYLG